MCVGMLCTVPSVVIVIIGSVLSIIVDKLRTPSGIGLLGMVPSIAILSTVPSIGVDICGPVARKPVFGGLRPTKAQTSLRYRAV